MRRFFQFLLVWLAADLQIDDMLTGIKTGMAVGLVLRLTSDNFIQSVVSFNYQFFFNLLLPPIILASGYELHQVGL